MTSETAALPTSNASIIPRDGFQVSQLTTWAKDLPIRRRRLNFMALLVILATFGVGGVWAVTAKIGGAVSASGRVVAADTNPVIQHLEGGIIKSILVREGDVVQAGEPLAYLDETADQSQLHATKVQQAMLSVELQRWRATRSLATELKADLSEFGEVANDARVVDTIESQSAELVAATESTGRRLAILDTTIATEEEDISSLGDLLTAYGTQIDLVKEELTGLKTLLADGLTTRTRVLSLERGLAQLTAQQSEAEFTVNKSRHNILSAEQQKEAILLDVQEQANQNISRVQGQLNQLADVSLRLEERLSRVAIKAPVDGVVFRINFKSEGAVLPSGQTFMEIFPLGDDLAIETLLSPKDIADVSVGQAVDVVFASDHNEALTPLAGTVQYVSTDTIVNNDTGGSFYVVRTVVDAGQDERIVLPGNTAEVYFKTTPKTLLEYVLEPITRFAFRSFKG